MPSNFLVNEGNYIGGQDPQALGTETKKITASVAVTKGQLVEATGDWTVGPAGALSTKVVGIAMNDAIIGGRVTICATGFVKLDSTAAVTAGAKVIPGADGKVTAATASGTITVAEAMTIVGTCVAGCTGAGICYVILNK